MEKHEKHETKHEATGARPSPSDFDEFLPWACNQLQVEVSVVITRVVQNEYVSAALTDRSKSYRKSKLKVQSRTEMSSEQDKEDKSFVFRSFTIDQEVVRIHTTYDPNNNLVHIKFHKNKYIPRKILKIIGLIAKFHPDLTSVTINRGLDIYCIHEIRKLLLVSNITTVCLDDTFLQEANYFILLENCSTLRQISLARCRIDDEVLKKIADCLVYPLPSSKNLSVLNIPSNRITDIGVKYLAEALRSNRHLAYLNVADNMITDEGASVIFSILREFSITAEELTAARCRHLSYLKEKNVLVSKLVAELRISDDKKFLKKKNARPIFSAKKTKGIEKESSLKSIPDARSLINIDAAMFDRAEIMAWNVMGKFNDPFSNENTKSRDGVMYCSGNNTLCYLNLSYNSLSYFTLKKILEVLLYQKLRDRKPRGLINLWIDGNSMPVACKELVEIDDLLETGLLAHNRKNAIIKKKPASRSGK